MIEYGQRVFNENFKDIEKYTNVIILINISLKKFYERFFSLFI